MQTVSTGAKEGFLRTGLQIIRNDGSQGLYHGVSYYRSKYSLHHVLKVS